MISTSLILRFLLSLGFYWNRQLVFRVSITLFPSSLWLILKDEKLSLPLYILFPRVPTCP